MTVPGSATGDDTAAIRGRVPASPRWRPVRDLNNDGAARMHGGDAAGAVARLEEAVARTRGHDRDGEALDLRARALLNLAAIREGRGAPADALRLSDEALACADAALALIGDERATRTVALNGRLSRSQTLLALDRADEALAEVDAVEHDLAALRDAGRPADQDELLTASLHNVRTGLFITLGRLHEAAQEARRTVAAAVVVTPALAAHAYANLAAIAQATGEGSAEEYLRLAAQLHGDDADTASRQLVTENLARAAFQDDRDDEAAELFRRAAAMAREAGLTARLAACRTGSAAIELRRGRAGRAVKALRTLIDDLAAVGAVHEEREANGFLGDALSALGRFDDAQAAYRRARELTRSVHERCRVDLRRAEAFAEQSAETDDPAARIELLETALRLAVPVHLTTEALREDFPAGPARERWAGVVTAPSRELAFRLAATLGRSELLHDLIENASASATLRVDAVGASVPSALEEWDGDEPGLAWPDDELPAAAAGFALGDGDGPLLRFAAPPRVVAFPGAPPALAGWIEHAEAVYGVRVRSAGSVVSW
ncbi:hypothetical protein [Tsukamurella pseudospumae]|uniref:MalT-like TPR region domain-containing protein n=1 Tax=Tsukamurella pseudospumae TaxID=239498 RepID=A0A138AV26_9ACTN|nr:hypothetical protein [Tsukamurella pseudospumae]KXP14273.1 hypothetical protein AXK60_20860 [Tsukamurella pseudospumae]